MKDRKRATSPRRRDSNSTARASKGGGRSQPRQGAAGASWWRRFDKRWLVFIPALFIVWLSYSYARIAVTLTPPSQVIEGAQGIDILDRNGNLIFAFGDAPGSGRVVPLDELSPYLVDATVAAEDAEFWNHPGVNVKGLARAAYENVAFWETGGLFKGSGGSSITQQLAKNLYIKPEDRAGRSPKRKLNETLIAFELKRRYSKQQILEWYLANNYYGNGVYGIESASYRYLSKPPSELTLAEAALLAGLPRSPGYYDPIGNYEAAVDRQAEVLGLMVRHHFISQAEMDEALAQPVALNEGRNPDERTVADDLLAPHFAEYVREQLPVLLGQEKVQGHLTVTTTLDLDLQAMAVKAVQDQIAKLEAQGATNGALVAIDPATGEILAMVGSYDFTRDDISGQVNNATGAEPARFDDEAGDLPDELPQGLVAHDEDHRRANNDRSGRRRVQAGQRRREVPRRGAGAHGAGQLAERAGGEDAAIRWSGERLQHGASPGREHAARAEQLRPVVHAGRRRRHAAGHDLRLLRAGEQRRAGGHAQRPGPAGGLAAAGPDIGAEDRGWERRRGLAGRAPPRAHRAGGRRRS